MVDKDVLGCNWIKIPATKYRLRSKNDSPAPVSQCQLELDVACDQFVSYPAEGEWQKVAPYRILSFDIECAGRRGMYGFQLMSQKVDVAKSVMFTCMFTCMFERIPVCYALPQHAWPQGTVNV